MILFDLILLILSLKSLALGDKTGDTALHYAAIGGHSEPILSLVNKGADVNSVNNNRRTALHIAVMNRNIDIVGSLVKVGADVNVPDNNGDTPFQLAVIQESFSTFNK